MNDIEFTFGVALQENSSILINLPERIMPNESPESGHSLDIGFGHKLTPREIRSGKVVGLYPYENGITLRQALSILEMDIREAQSFIYRKYGHENVSQIHYPAFQLLTDFVFNGAFKYFPKFVKAITSTPVDLDTAFKEYKRYWTDESGNKRELSRRNEFTLRLLLELQHEVHGKS